MKALLCLPLLLAAGAGADEASDRVAIGRAIAAVNNVPAPDALFTADSDAADALQRICRDNPPVYRFPSWERGHAAPGTVSISQEPWGEATIGLPLPPGEITNPRIEGRSIRFLTQDVALVDGACVYRTAAGTRITPLLFVMKKDADDWKIASLRVLAA